MRFILSISVKRGEFMMFFIRTDVTLNNLLIMSIFSFASQLTTESIMFQFQQAMPVLRFMQLYISLKK